MAEQGVAVVPRVLPSLSRYCCIGSDRDVAVEMHLCSWRSGDEGAQGASCMPQHCALPGSAMMLVPRDGRDAATSLLHQCVFDDDAVADGGGAACRQSKAECPFALAVIVLQRSEDPFGLCAMPKGSHPTRWSPCWFFWEPPSHHPPTTRRIPSSSPLL